MTLVRVNNFGIRQQKAVRIVLMEPSITLNRISVYANRICSIWLMGLSVSLVFPLNISTSRPSNVSIVKKEKYSIQLAWNANALRISRLKQIAHVLSVIFLSISISNKRYVKIVKKTLFIFQLSKNVKDAQSTSLFLMEKPVLPAPIINISILQTKAVSFAQEAETMIK